MWSQKCCCGASMLNWPMITIWPSKLLSTYVTVYKCTMAKHVRSKWRYAAFPTQGQIFAVHIARETPNKSRKRGRETFSYKHEEYVKIGPCVWCYERKTGHVQIAVACVKDYCIIHGYDTQTTTRFENQHFGGNQKPPKENPVNEENFWIQILERRSTNQTI